MKRLVALALSSLIAGCCHCSDAQLPEHPQRPGDVVRELRDAVGDRQWEKAAECFSADIRSKNQDRLASGAFFDASYPGDQKVGSFLPVPFPLGPRDVITSISVEDEKAVASIEHVGFDEPDTRPRELILIKDQEGRWHISSWR